MLKEFKEFAMRGNVVDMAVGIILGAAFGLIAKSLVNDVLMPPIGLALGDVDIGAVIAGALQQSQADRVDRHDQQSAGGVHDFRQLANVFQGAKEVWLLHKHAGGVVGKRGFKCLRRDRALRRANRYELRFQVRQVSMDCLAVLRMNASRCHYPSMPARNSHGH